MNVHFDCKGEGSLNRIASMDESVETADESVETRDESIEAGERTQQSCIKWYNAWNISSFNHHSISKLHDICSDRDLKLDTLVTKQICLSRSSDYWWIKLWKGVLRFASKSWIPVTWHPLLYFVH